MLDAASSLVDRVVSALQLKRKFIPGDMVRIGSLRGPLVSNDGITASVYDPEASKVIDVGADDLELPMPIEASPRQRQQRLQDAVVTYWMLGYGIPDISEALQREGYAQPDIADALDQLSEYKAQVEAPRFHEGEPVQASGKIIRVARQQNSDTLEALDADGRVVTINTSELDTGFTVLYRLAARLEVLATELERSAEEATEAPEMPPTPEVKHRVDMGLKRSILPEGEEPSLNKVQTLLTVLEEHGDPKLAEQLVTMINAAIEHREKLYEAEAKKKEINDAVAQLKRQLNWDSYHKLESNLQKLIDGLLAQISEDMLALTNATEHLDDVYSFFFVPAIQNLTDKVFLRQQAVRVSTTGEPIISEEALTKLKAFLGVHLSPKAFKRLDALLEDFLHTHAPPVTEVLKVMTQISRPRAERKAQMREEAPKQQKPPKKLEDYAKEQDEAKPSPDKDLDGLAKDLQKTHEKATSASHAVANSAKEILSIAEDLREASQELDAIAKVA